MDYREKIEELLRLFREDKLPQFLAQASPLLEDEAISKGLRAKIYSWVGQAYNKEREYSKALRMYGEAITLAKEIEDFDGIETLNAEVEKIQSQADAISRIDGSRKTPLAMGVNLLKQGQKTRAENALLSAVVDADTTGSNRSKVLSRLALAQLEEYRVRMLEEAYNIAVDCGDRNLIVAVKKTMEQFNIKLPPKVF